MGSPPDGDADGLAGAVAAAALDGLALGPDPLPAGAADPLRDGPAEPAPPQAMTAIATQAITAGRRTR
jgi:hypothetical protein